MKISIIIPAYNEEKNIANCINSIKESIKGFVFEIIVVINWCTDNTEKIAKKNWAITVREDIKNLSRIRNVWIKNSTWDLIVTIDADSLMTKDLISEIVKASDTGEYIGWWVDIIPERMSLWIYCTKVMVDTYFLLKGISAWAFWFKREDFDKIEWFNEELFIAEDVDFALRLKEYWLSIWKEYKNIKTAWIVTSCRKFDKFWDWHWFKFMFLNTKEVLKSLKENNAFSKKYFYNFKR